MPAKKIVYDLSVDPPAALERFAVVANELVAVDPKRFAFEVPAKAAQKAEATKVDTKAKP